MNLTGLSDKEVIDNRQKYGSNSLKIETNTTFFNLFMETLGDPIIKILLIALGIKIVFLFKDFDWYETIGIVISILIASLISSISEYGSAKAFKRLKEQLEKTKCYVKRNNNIKEIYSDEVVCNDLIILSTGDKIVADGIIISGSITTDESAITGESKEKYKIASKNFPQYKEENYIYKGTNILSGSGLMIATNVGENTYYGKMTHELTIKDDPSVLKLRLTKLAKTISIIGYISAILVFISYLFNVIVISNNYDIEIIKEILHNKSLIFKYILDALTICVTIIIVCVPEGLPMMITLVLSSNMKRMFKNNILVRKLDGIETAGSLNILFTDKTGTLTKGNHEVVGYMLGNNNIYHSLNEVSEKYRNTLKLSIIYNNDSIYDSKDGYAKGSNQTDRCLLNYIKENKKDKIKVIDKVPFTSENKYSISIIDNGKKMKLVKGAPEIIIDKCNKYMTEEGIIKNIDKKEVKKLLDKYSSKSLRMVAIAIMEDGYTKEYMKNMMLISIMFIKDEIRSNAKDSIRQIKKAGIDVVMITGDNIKTAISISKELNIINDKEDICLTSDEFNKMTDEEVKEILPNLKVLARSLPTDKSRLIKIAKSKDLIVGMTGDGINDAPALKRADVGFAMGSGTNIAKEASDIIIIDNNISSICQSILFGRTIFKSIRKFIICQLTINLIALLISIIGPFIGISMPVTVIQMLWINMVMDTLAGLAYSYELPLKEYMNEKPKKKNESIINNYMLITILVTGIFCFIVCIVFLKSNYIASIYRIGINNEYLLTAFFGLFIFMGIFNIINARTHRINILAKITTNKVFILIIIFITVVQISLIYYGGTLFRTSGLLLKEFIFMFILASLVIPVDIVKKLILKILGKNNGV